MKWVILAWGHGTRMLPINKTIPKELLPVGNKPVIQYTVEWLVDIGISDIMIVTAQSKKALEDYFDKNYELEETLKRKGKNEYLEAINKPKYMANYAFVKQREQLGTWHAALQAAPWVSDDYFFYVAGDEIFHPQTFHDMKKKFEEEKRAIICLEEVPMELVHKYGVVSLEGDDVVGFVEKPSQEDAPSNLVWFSLAIFPQEVFELLKDVKPNSVNGEIYITDAILKLIEQRKVGFIINRHGHFDVGSQDGWLAANVQYQQRGSLF